MRTIFESLGRTQRCSFIATSACAIACLCAIPGSAQTGTYRFTGSKTNITLSPGTYNIKAYGAKGGSAAGFGTGGLGAEMEALFNFPTATTLTILVGGRGTSSVNNYGRFGGGGGGGASFVANGTAPLLIAGGGGGGGLANSGDPGLTGTSGSNGTYGGGTGGTNGYGGGNQAWGGGGGYYGGGSAASGGGSSFLDGGIGGSGAAGNGGGYGGGGGGSDDGGHAGGGGGGYSGGGGGGYPGAGGGGGSYIDSSAIAVLTQISGVASPDDSPNGQVMITGGPGPLLTNLVVNPTNSIIAVGTNQAFAATGYFSDGSVVGLGVTNGLVWSSSNPAVAGVNSNGVATALSPGITTITATDGGTSNNATLFVMFPAAGQNVFLFTGTMARIAISPGTYDITAYGARGGFGDNNSAGAFGAEMGARFSFGTATTLTLLVGGAGQGGSSGLGSGGGGGGSFVVSGSTPLVVAGGGGGGSYGGAGIPASITTSGSNGGGLFGGPGGSNGSGGSAGYADGAGGGGGGFNGNGGGTVTSSGASGGGGSSFSNGGSGGRGNSPGGNGGYGGGGGAGGGFDGFISGGGGGGGYSGGGGGGGGYNFIGGGGGGGSIIDSSAAAILTAIPGVASPIGSPNGAIIITAVPIMMSSVSTTTGQFGFTIVAPNNSNVVVQTCTNLANPIWIPLATNTLSNGTNHFSDPQWTNYPSRYYRVRSQ